VLLLFLKVIAISILAVVLYFFWLIWGFHRIIIFKKVCYVLLIMPLFTLITFEVGCMVKREMHIFSKDIFLKPKKSKHQSL
jgi:hypothetical protein